MNAYTIVVTGEIVKETSADNLFEYQVVSLTYTVWCNDYKKAYKLAKNRYILQMDIIDQNNIKLQLINVLHEIPDDPK